MTADAIVVGSGPNGLAAAITLAQAGFKTLLREAQAGVGGGLRSSELTLPGFTHDVCSAVHPFALSSPFFRTLPLAGFGLEWIQPAAALAHPLDDGSAVPLDALGTAAFGLLLSIAGHAVGWPIARGGSQRVADALAAYFRSLGGEIVTAAPVEHLDELESARLVLLDLSPRQVLRIAGGKLPDGYRRALERYRYGAAAFKVDWALDGPVPWTAPECARAATVHLGGTLEEVVASEAAPARGTVHDRPFVLCVQPTLFDTSRAPDGRHTAWAYCHVPNGHALDVSGRIERQVERFAPGFRDRILARSVLTPADFERRNANLIGGDINGGMMD